VLRENPVPLAEHKSNQNFKNNHKLRIIVTDTTIARQAMYV